MPTINLTGGGAQPPGGQSPTPQATPEQRAAERQGRMEERAQRMAERAERARQQIDVTKARVLGQMELTTARNKARVSEVSAKATATININAEKSLANLRMQDARKLAQLDLANIRAQTAATVAGINAQARAQATAARIAASQQNAAARLAATAPQRAQQQQLGVIRLQSAQLRLQQQQQRTAAGAGAGGRGGGGGRIVGAIAGAAGGGFIGAGAGALMGGLFDSLPPIIGTIVKGIIGTALAGVELQYLPGQLMHRVLGAAQPAIDLTKGTFALGRAGGFSGKGLYNKLFPGTGTTEGSEWMGSLMLTPEKILQSMAAYGISPRNQAELLGNQISFGKANLTPGLVGLGPNAAEGIARQGAAYGATPTTLVGMSAYLSQFSGILEQAVSEGMDRAKVLGNIQDAIDVVAKGSIGGVSVPGVMDTIARFASAGTPGGRTGQSALDAISAQANTLANSGSHPDTSFLMMSQMKKFDGLKTRAGIEAYLGPKNMEALNQNPAMRDKLFKDAMSMANSGSTYAAMNLLNQTGMQSSPDRLQELMRPALKELGIPSAYRTMALGNVTGMGTQHAYESVVGGKSGSFGQGTGYLQSDDYYRNALQANGVPSKYIDSFIREGKKQSISPLLLAAIAAQESGGGDPSKINQKAISPGGDRGIMQISPANQPKYFGAVGQGGNSATNIYAGADILAGDLRQANGNLPEALGRYNAGSNFAGTAGREYAGNVAGIYARMQSRLPTGMENIGQAENQAAQATLAGADTTLNRFVPLISSASDALERFISVVSTAATKFDNNAVPTPESTSPRGIHTSSAPAPLLRMQ